MSFLRIFRKRLINSHYCPFNAIKETVEIHRSIINVSSDVFNFYFCLYSGCIGTGRSYTGLSTIFGGEEARFDGAFEELIDVTAVIRGRGSHNAGNLNTSRTCPRRWRQKAVTRPCRCENV